MQPIIRTLIIRPEPRACVPPFIKHFCTEMFFPAPDLWRVRGLLMLHLQLRRKFGSSDPRTLAASDSMGDGGPCHPAVICRTGDFIDLFDLFLDHHLR